MNWFKKLFGDESTRALKRIRPLVDEINELEPLMQELSDEAFSQKTTEFKERLKNGETLDDVLVEAFALAREAAFRTLGLRAYDVQLIGGIVMHEGNIAEMRTGEGKTLVAVLPAYLNALTGNGVHIVTVNDYLARRDAHWMGQVYSFLGISTSVINDRSSFIYNEDTPKLDQESEADEKRDELGSFKVDEAYLESCDRKSAYEADITYGTNNQFGFDYLRDNTQKTADALAQRHHNPHAFAIVDEIDSILIDEARVPLILSTKSLEGQDLYPKFARVAQQLETGDDYDIDEKLKAVTLNDDGISKAEKALGIDNLYTDEGVGLVHHLEAALKAKSLYVRDTDYVIKDGEVVIVDPFTGRLQAGRRWSEGLHQSIEAKEGVNIGAETKTMASITYQNYFKFYDKLAGMTGTARTSSEEFFKVYDLEVIEIPTNKPVARIDHGDLIYQTEDEKFKAIARDVKELHEKGQPVLIGTVAIEKNELLSAYMTREGVPHEVLNAKNHEREGEIVAQAGRKGSVTIATNMAGRGVDIKLGGVPADEEKEEAIKSLGGLCVVGTERHDARRIDNQLRGRAGRQGDPGLTQFYVSLEDPLMRIFGSDRVKKMISTLGVPKDEPIQNKMISNALERAQEKIEGFNFDSRKQVLAYDDVLSQHRETIYARRRTLLFNEHDALGDLFEEIQEKQTELAGDMRANREKFDDKELFWNTFRHIALTTTDKLWMEHLQVMDHTRQSVNLRAYGQRQPIVEYKKEGLRLFREMENAFYHQVATILARMDVNAIQKAQQIGEKTQAVTSEATDVEPEDLKPNDKVVITKDGEEKIVKVKKLPDYETAGWTIRQ